MKKETYVCFLKQRNSILVFSRQQYNTLNYKTLNIVTLNICKLNIYIDLR